MSGFDALAGLMVLVCLGCAVVPLWYRPRGKAGDRRRGANIEVYRQRCHEIDAEVSAGRLPAEEAAAEKDALGMRLLSDVDAGDTRHTAAFDSQPVGSGSRLIASVLGAGLIVLAASAGYYWLGDPGALDNRGMPNIDQLMTELEQNVAANPDDRGARLMLAQAYQDRGQFARAATQLQAVNEAAAPPSADLLVAEAQARLQAGQALAGQVGDLFQQALVQEPGNPQALWFLGLRAAEAGDADQAVSFWDRLLKQDLPPEARDMVQSRRNALAGDVPSL